MADRYIEISNLGEVEVEAFSLLGASDKRDDDNKIGMFGSGNKYSIAWLVRNKIEFHIFSGTNHIKVTTIEKLFRDKTFNVICLNGIETSITDSLGKDWTAEYVVRELVSNAIDEMGFTYNIVSDVIPETGFTKIYLDYSKFMNINLDSMFTFLRDDKPVFTKDNFKIYTNKYNRIYRKGIWVYDFERNDNALTYELDFDNVRINEERQSSLYDVASKLQKVIGDIPANVIFNIITSKKYGDLRVLNYASHFLHKANMEYFRDKVIMSENHVIIFGIPDNAIVLHPDSYHYVYNAFSDKRDLCTAYGFRFISTVSNNVAYKEDTSKAHVVSMINELLYKYNLPNEKDICIAELSDNTIEYFYHTEENIIVINKYGNSDANLISLGIAASIIIGIRGDFTSTQSLLAGVTKLLVNKIISQ